MLRDEIRDLHSYLDYNENPFYERLLQSTLSLKTVNMGTFSFNSLWSFYSTACAAAGILRFLEPEKRTRSLRIYQKFCQFSISLFVFSTTYTLATQMNNLTVVIIAGAGIVIFFAVCAGPIRLCTSYDDLMAIINWCSDLHNNGERFDRIVRPFAMNHFDAAGQKSMKIMKTFTYVLVFDGFATTILFTIVANLLPGEILLEKYHPPFPFDVPFHGEATWKSFLVNLIIQSAGIVNGTLLGNVVMSIYCVIFVHLLAYLDVILVAVAQLDDFLKCKYRGELFESGECDTFVEILNEVEENLGPPVNDLTAHIKIIVNMCSEFNE